MKKGKILSGIVLLMSVFWTSCVRNELYDPSGLVEEGLPARISIQFKSQENAVVTRAERDPKYENRVDNIYIFIFDSQGNVHERKFCTPGDGGLSYTNDTYEEGTLSVATKSLNNARIVGIANVSVDGVTATAYSITEADLDGVQDYASLENMVMKMTSPSIERYAIFMMTGVAEHTDPDGTVSTDITIPGSESGTSTLDCSLKLRRTDAKVKFVVKTNNKNGYQDFSFSPRSWVVKRIPAQSHILPKETGDYDGDDAVYFTSMEVPFEKVNRDESNPKLYTGGEFVFYMPENRKVPKSEIQRSGSETDDQLYALREKWENKTTDGDKVFTYANDNSTYVEMTGILSYYNEDGKNTNADIRMIVHLGNPNETGSYDANNYNTNRNTFYTYNIEIRGVDDIKTEVIAENPDEVRPGYEGDVVNTEKKAFVFDSHYDRCLIYINPQSLPDAENGGKIYWSVNTPFSRGVYTVSDTEPVPEELRDYRWIKFAVNEEYGVGENQFVKYPGDQNYNDPYAPADDPNNNKPSPYYAPGGDGYKNFTSSIFNTTINTENARLMDVNQLLKYLQDKKQKGIDRELTVSVFVDEHLYFKHPLTGETDNESRSLWKLTSDKQDRILYLIIKEAKYSQDNNSSVVTAEYSFRQRTIRTIYNVDKPELKTAWGLESVMETGRLAPGNVSQGTDLRNGRANCLKWLVGKNWTDIVNVTGNLYELKYPYNNAAYACLLRNRDLDGDNVVDAEEVRWYLASIDQLTDIYIGEPALDEQSRLYPSNAADRENQTRWHYTSSTRYDNNQSWIIWAEEGASRGSSGGSINDAGSNNTSFSYKCVRNLGIRLDNIDEVPSDLVEVIPETDGFYLIDMTNMNPKAVRSTYVTTLPAHHEREDVNRPYSKFRVHKDLFAAPVEPVHGGQLNWPWSSENDASWKKNTNMQNWEYYQTANVCPSGYRVPNQRELLIMTSRMFDSKYWPIYTVTAEYWYWEGGLFDHYIVKGSKEFTNCKPDHYICISQTAFSMCNKGIYKDKYEGNKLITRQGFLWTSQNGGTFYLQNSKDEMGWVRPVQDVQ